MFIMFGLGSVFPWFFAGLLLCGAFQGLLGVFRCRSVSAGTAMTFKPLHLS